MERSHTPCGELYCARCQLSTANRTGTLGKELRKDEPRGARRTLATFDWVEELSVRADGLASSSGLGACLV